MNLNNLQIENIIIYNGNLDQYRNKKVVIDSIIKGTDEDSYLVKVLGEETSFRAYKNEIIPIPIDYELLEELGFEKTNISGKNVCLLNGKIFLNITILYPELVDFRGVHILNDGVDINDFNVTQIEEKSIPVRYLHSLQNYYNESNSNPNLNYQRLK